MLSQGWLLRHKSSTIKGTLFQRPHQISNMPSFFFGKYLCATYPQSPSLSTDIILAFYLDKFDCDYICVSKEQHQDGTPHFHAAVKFSQKTRLLPTDCDINGRHPNLQPAKKWVAWVQYVKKDGIFLEHGRNAPVVTGEPSVVCEQFPDYLSWLDYCIAHKIPHAAAKEIHTLVHFKDLHTIVEEDAIAIPNDRINFTLDHDFNESRSLILVGETGCGKTSWAKKYAPKPALFVRHLDTLGQFRPGFHASIIFDDLSFLHTPRAQQLFLVDMADTSSIHIRYKCAVIPAGTPRIFTCNEGFEPVDTNDAAIKRRCMIVRIRNL